MKTLEQKARKITMDGVFGSFEKRYCRLCKRYNSKNGYCYVLKRSIKNPDAPNCSWFMKEFAVK